jgi:hypothetical protein
MVFFCFVITAAQSRELWEVIAGVAERYATGLVGMKAFVAPFHHMKHMCGEKRHARSGTATADSSARFCIEMWRAEALLLWSDRIAVAVPIRWMTLPSVTKLYTESDAGPEGIGAVVYDRNGKLLAHTGYRLPWSRDTRNLFQNQREYIGLLIAMVMLHRIVAATEAGMAALNRKTVAVRFTGDNTTAQAWIEKAKCSSRGGQLSCMAVTWMQIHSQLRVEDTVHKEGIKMGFVDSLSRFYPTPELDMSLSMGLQDDDALTALLVECDPSSKQSDVMEHHQAFTRINAALMSITSPR